jgi:FtsP/CotA-like multicopper oxidase with cupredoxin domain
VRVEGGTVTGRVTALSDGGDLGEVEIPLGYPAGQILLGPADRADVVLVPTGSPGDEIELRWEDVVRGRHGHGFVGDEMVMAPAEDDGLRPGESVATFRLVDGEATEWALGEGDPVLGAIGRAATSIELTEQAVQWTGDDAMVLSEDMQMWQDENGVWQMSTDLFVDGVSWHPDHDGGPEQAEAPSAVHARLGDTIVWEIRNESEMSHPVHLHGFSYQPTTFVQTDEEAGTVTSWDLGYDEVEDTTLVPGETSLLLRMRLDDPVGDGGALGRWMRHCHVFQHGEHGMMSEFIVDP